MQSDQMNGNGKNFFRRASLRMTAVLVAASILSQASVRIAGAVEESNARARRTLQVWLQNETEGSIQIEYGSGEVPADSLISSVSGMMRYEGPDTIDTSEVGETTVSYHLWTFSSIGLPVGKTVRKTIRVVDTTAPVITLRESSVTICQGDAFDPMENIESVTDNRDGALICRQECVEGAYAVISDVQTSRTGDYTVHVEAEDSSGNAAYAEYTVHVTPQWQGERLSPSKGAVSGPSGRETYYNLDMSGCVAAMRAMGFSEEEYPYWVREDGVKMLGDYVMAAANLSLHPKGTLVECSLGTAIVVDTGGFAQANPTQLDIAVAW